MLCVDLGYRFLLLSLPRRLVSLLILNTATNGRQEHAQTKRQEGEAVESGRSEVGKEKEEKVGLVEF